MSLSTTAPPPAYPVSLAEIKAQARIDTSDDDAYLTGLIAAATEYAENLTGRVFVARSQVWQIDAFPQSSASPLVLPVAPVRSITEISYVDASGGTQTWGPSGWFLDSDDYRPSLRPAYGISWPSVRAVANAVSLTLETGYAGDGGSPEDHAANVPEPVKLAIKMIAAHWYDTRGAAGEKGLSEIPHGAGSLLMAYKLQGF